MCALVHASHAVFLATTMPQIMLYPNVSNPPIHMSLPTRSVISSGGAHSNFRLVLAINVAVRNMYVFIYFEWELVSIS